MSESKSSVYGGRGPFQVLLLAGLLAISWPYRSTLLGHVQNLLLSPQTSSDLATLSANHNYSTQILSTDPFMVYVHQFLHPAEIAHLLEISESRFGKARIAETDGSYVASEHRTSTTYTLPRDDPAVAAINARALSFVGFLPHDGIEVLQLVRYGPTQKIAYHNDWFEKPLKDRDGHKYNRLASFFLYLDANCTGGETYFRDMPPPPTKEHEGDLFRTTDDRKGLAVIPKAGSGVFWRNLFDDDSGDTRTLHGGLPVEEGTKVGMNVWIKKIVQ